VGRLSFPFGGCLAPAIQGSQITGRSQTLGCCDDVQDDRSVLALQSVRRSSGVSNPRPSFVHAVFGSGLDGKVPDAKTVWLYRDQLTQGGVIDALFKNFDGYLKEQGYLSMGGQIIDASLVSVPTQHNSRDENTKIKNGEMPEGWADSAYRSAEIEKMLKDKGLTSRIHRKGRRNKPLSTREE
jgi:hypothetical protein